MDIFVIPMWISIILAACFLVAFIVQALEAKELKKRYNEQANTIISLTSRVSKLEQAVTPAAIQETQKMNAWARNYQQTAAELMMRSPMQAQTLNKMMAHKQRADEQAHQEGVKHREAVEAKKIQQQESTPRESQTEIRDVNLGSLPSSLDRSEDS